MAKTVSKKIFYSEFVCRLLSSKNLNKLERAVGKYNVGFLFIQITDFYPYVGAYGAEAGFDLIMSVEEEAGSRFHKFFPDCEILFAEPLGLGELLICFEFPNRLLFNLSEQVLSFRSDIRERISRISNKGDKAEILAGYSWTDRHNKGSFYKTVFRAVCEAEKMQSPVIFPAIPI